MDIFACAGRTSTAPAAVRSTSGPSVPATRRISRYNRVKGFCVGGGALGNDRSARPGASLRGSVQFPHTRRGIIRVCALGGDDEDDDAAFDANFGDIDRLAAEAEAAADGEDDDAGDDDPDATLMSFGSQKVVEFGLSGRPLYVCQSIWWLRLSQLKTYPPDVDDVRDIARRSGLTTKAVQKWFADALDHYHGLSLVDKANYDVEAQVKLDRMEALIVRLGTEKPGLFDGRDDEPVNVAAPWKEEGKLDRDEQEKLTLKDPLYIAMDALPDVMAKEAAEAKLEKDTEEGLDDDAIARIPQDGSAEQPFLINPYSNSKVGSWSIVKKVGPPTAFEDSIDWLESGGWEALPDHEIASAVDGGSLKFVGVSDQTIEGSRDRLDIAMPSNADSLAVAEEIDSDGILREAVRHIGDLSRKPLHKLTIGEELEGEIVSVELYHGALVDCGCETDGLIPISENDWPDLVDTLTTGTKVKVKVKALYEKWWRFRFPIELDVLTPNVGHLIKTHPHEDGPPINIYSGETVPYANMDAGRPLDKFFEVSDVDDEEEERLRVQAISEWVDEKMAETEKTTKKKGNRMQRVLAAAKAAAAAAADEKSAANQIPVDEDEEDARGMSDGGAAQALDTGDGLRGIGERTEEMIAAEEEEEEAALFGGEKTVVPSVVGRKEDPDAVEEGEDDEEDDTAADENFDGNVNPEAEDTRGGVVTSADDLTASSVDYEDDDEGEDDDDEATGSKPKKASVDDDDDENEDE